MGHFPENSLEGQRSPRIAKMGLQMGEQGDAGLRFLSFTPGGLRLRERVYLPSR